MSKEAQFGDKAEWIRTLPCLVCGNLPSQAAHVKSRGAGGLSEDLVPLCHTHHAEQHAIGMGSFMVKIGMDLSMQANRLEALWLSTQT